MPLPVASSGWQLPPLALALAAAALVLFGRAFLRLRRRGRPDRAPWWKAVALAAAVGAGLLALASPLDALAERKLVSAHMLQHVVIADLVPALALVALRGPLLALTLPRALARALARVAPLREGMATLARPGPAFAAWGGAIGAWHLPVAYEAALSHALLHQLQHVTLLLGGLLVWWQLIDPARRGALSPLARLGYAVALLAAGGALVNVLVFSGPLYPSYAELPSRPLGLTAARDQELAGLVMLVEQWLTVGTYVAVTVSAWPRGVLFPGSGEAKTVDRHPFAL